MFKVRFVFVIVFSGIIAGLVFISSKEDIPAQALSKEAVILAFGDSLTYGKGAPAQSYPVQLERITGHRVVNGGLSGEDSSQGLKRLPSLLNEYKPRFVILCHGGNDLIRQLSKEKLRANIIQMIRLSKEAGAQVLLVGVPDFKLVRFSTESLYEEVAWQEGVLFEGEVLRMIENTASLKSDRVHPNAKGYALMAKAFAEVLKENGVL